MSRPVSLVKRRQGGLGFVLGPQVPRSGNPSNSPAGSPARSRRASTTSASPFGTSSLTTSSSSATWDGACAPRPAAAVVQTVVPGGEADRTGLIRPGDVVLRVNGTCVTGFEHGNCLLGQVPDDAPVTLELACNGALNSAGGATASTT